MMPSMTSPDRCRRQEIPTHLDVQDRAFLGLSVRQVLGLCSGAACSYGLWQHLASLFPTLPAGLHVLPAILSFALVVTILMVRPGGRELHTWAAVTLRYATLPKRAVWRPALPAAVVRASWDPVAAAPPASTGWVEWVPQASWFAWPIRAAAGQEPVQPEGREPAALVEAEVYRSPIRATVAREPAMAGAAQTS
jgi:hypothetical protein